MDKFKVGDRVKIKQGKHIDHTYLGECNEGEVISVEWREEYKDSELGVSWYDFKDGHNCAGEITDDSGWYVWAEDVELV